MVDLVVQDIKMLPPEQRIKEFELWKERLLNLRFNSRNELWRLWQMSVYTLRKLLRITEVQELEDIVTIRMATLPPTYAEPGVKVLCHNSVTYQPRKKKEEES